MSRYIDRPESLGRKVARVAAALIIAPIMNHLPGNLEIARAELPSIQEVWSPPRSVQNILAIQDEEDAKDFPSRT
ncbi:hypothetical protein A3C59_00760 [Candidatus Daviesbacteria bacterium RIFCSPHIGHO2_02_FULL_36_13]|uniref:Uncharacterized protein n=1 Tax=Candidatus Daviesbacteria bacterium RIFCSPHIGHO2_02_FULL_36_13 TaxID=1797768 RepID=A0A1F5JRK2_9BACT|nr:MAG: hypothetical protein A3C59_00760 [Candidatus Daviesbacteria bacterium RIFCSPHIGHO2_02_FULL_36_13]OGE41013.1 MAG: hypothetical protein A3A45_02895 [Candidatus Daviesbacteria bacterium RIFCSPLOWO2_01_FULL_36_8]